MIFLIPEKENGKLRKSFFLKTIYVMKELTICGKKNLNCCRNCEVEK